MCGEVFARNKFTWIKKNSEFLTHTILKIAFSFIKIAKEVNRHFIKIAFYPIYDEMDTKLDSTIAILR